MQLPQIYGRIHIFADAPDVHDGHVARKDSGTYESAGRRLLGTWLQKTRHSQAEFGRVVGLSALAMSNVLTGRTRPSLSVAIRVEEATEGAVKCSAWKLDS